MIKFIPLDGYACVSLTNTSYFTTDYTHYIHNKEAGFVVSDNYDELKQYVSIKTFTYSTPTFKPKEKVFITKNSAFPSLLLTRLASLGYTDLKRTVKESTADYIVVNPISKVPAEISWRQYRNDDIFCIYPDNVNNIVNMFVLKSKYSGERTATMGLYQTVQDHYKTGVYYALYFNNISELELIHNYPSKVILSSHLTKSIQPKCPKPSDEEWASLAAMIASSDSEQRKLSWDMLQCYDLSDRYLDLFSVLLMQSRYSESIPPPSGRSTSMKYVTDQLGFPYERIYNRYSSELLPSDLYTLYNNPLASSTLKAQIYKRVFPAIAAYINDYFKHRLSIVGLEVKVKVKDGSEPLEDASYGETTIISEVLEKVSTSTITEMTRIRGVLTDFNLQLYFNRTYDAK